MTRGYGNEKRNMNIKITYNWLLEYLQTDADPYEIQKYLSLCGPSIERVEKMDDDFVFDIEITSNRVDSASVFGIAQECAAILPTFGKKAILKINTLERYTFKEIHGDSARHDVELEIKILGDNLASRVSAVVLSNIEIGESPQFMKDRLAMCDTKSINNVVDISNYLMLALGQPNHTFDYDKIKDHTLSIRESKKGEKVKTLDEKVIELPGGDIVIEDGSGNLTDLAGIMGGYDSMVTSATKNVLLLLETYDPAKIRKTSMTTGQRTVAATYFEKGLDPQRIEPTLAYGVELLEKYCGGQIVSRVIDVYPKPVKPKIISVSVMNIETLIGAPIETATMREILENLGFSVTVHGGEIEVTVPSYRAADIEVWQDIAEEVARMYGYHNLKSIVQSTRSQNRNTAQENYDKYELRAKYFLKHAGLCEVYNYSMISKKMIEKFGFDPKDHLKLQNTISQNIEYMRIHLVPSLVENILQNKGKRDDLSFFEIAKTYKKRVGDLPEETRYLAIATNQSYSWLKGVLAGLFKELNIDEYSFGEVEKNDDICAFELDFEELIECARPIPSYRPINPYSVVKLDLTYTTDPKHLFENIKSKAFKISPLLLSIDVISTFKNKVTLRFEFARTDQNITEKEAKEELEKIKELV